MEPSRYACLYNRFYRFAGSISITACCLYYCNMSLSFLIITTFPFQIPPPTFQYLHVIKFLNHLMYPFLLLYNQCRMLVCRPQESQRSFAMLLGMPCSCIRLLCQFRFVHVLTLHDNLVLCHEIYI